MYMDQWQRQKGGQWKIESEESKNNSLIKKKKQYKKI